MRRSTLIGVFLGALIGLAVAAGISLAGGSSSRSSGKSASAGQGSFRAAYAKRGGRRHGQGHGMGFGPLALALNGLADRLDVTPDKLRAAAKGVKKRALDRAVADGTITADERAALEACFASRGQGSGCDRNQARAAHRKLHRALEQRARTDAAGLKSQLVDDLAAELGKQPADVESAIRATLSDMLDKGVALGFVTAHGRELALGCWDKPNECDRAALRAELKSRFGGHERGRHGRHP